MHRLTKSPKFAVPNNLTSPKSKSRAMLVHEEEEDSDDKTRKSLSNNNARIFSDLKQSEVRTVPVDEVREIERPQLEGQLVQNLHSLQRKKDDSIMEVVSDYQLEYVSDYQTVQQQRGNNTLSTVLHYQLEEPELHKAKTSKLPDAARSVAFSGDQK